MSNRLLQKVRQVEERLEARLGLAVLDEESGQQWTYHADQRFPLCSTFKVLASGTFLATSRMLIDVYTREESKWLYGVVSRTGKSGR